MTKSQANDRFQGLCLKSNAGWMFMDTYDSMPPDVRKRLRESPFNLCAACVNGIGSGPNHYHNAIDIMEAKLFCEELQ